MSLFLFARAWIKFFWIANFVLLSVKPASATGVIRELGAESCFAAVELELNALHELLSNHPDGKEVFQVEVLSPGVLVLDVSDAFQSSSRPTVELIGRDCAFLQPEDVTYVERSLSRPIVKVNNPGTYHLVVTTFPGDAASSYRLHVGFSEAIEIRLEQWAMKDVEEWEDDVESSRTGLPTGGLPPLGDWAMKDVEEWEDDVESFGVVWAKDVEEWEDDVESFEAGGRMETCSGPARLSGETHWILDEPGVLAVDAAGSGLVAVLEPHRASRDTIPSAGTPLGPSRELLSRVEPGSYSLRWALSEASPDSCQPRFRFFPICGLSAPDDHGDTLDCATAIEVGSEVRLESSLLSCPFARCLSRGENTGNLSH